MKKFLISLSILFISCQKEIIPKIEKQKDVKIATQIVERPTIIKFFGKEFLSTIFFNSCTSEDIYISGFVHYQGSYIINENVQTHTYLFKYDSVYARGLVSGKIYKGTGYIIDTYKAVWNTGYEAFAIQEENIKNKIVFSLSGGNNNLVTTISYHLNLAKDGQIIRDEYKMELNQCK